MLTSDELKAKLRDGIRADSLTADLLVRLSSEVGGREVFRALYSAYLEFRDQNAETESDNAADWLDCFYNQAIPRLGYLLGDVNPNDPIQDLIWPSRSQGGQK